ncbi:hypothetical protein M422DRAFT_269153 [Sphaerobolus stellatus SS14]|uniref:Uncharacterized protein n=1 Tax=Sphaerobolus stellatus (strain SS14) TaxID=990650 RepID=A0A0C9U5G0_SPHS4|nr:hypothetical protein M422DRAFT_269153 [Sphaerobolus stellatus SS14]
MSSCDGYLTGHSPATEPFSFWIPVIGRSLKVMVSATIVASQRDRRVAGTHRYGSNAQEVLASGCVTEMAVARHDDSGRAVWLAPTSFGFLGGSSGHDDVKDERTRPCSWRSTVERLHISLPAAVLFIRTH